MENTFNIPKPLDNFRAYLNSFDNWKASTGEVLSIQEVIVTKNTFPSSFGILLHPVSELEKHRDLSRARWNITTSKVKEASASIDAYGVGKDETKVKFIDGYIPYLFPHERKNIGGAFNEFIKVLTNETSKISKEQKEIENYIKEFDSLLKRFVRGNDEIFLETKDEAFCKQKVLEVIQLLNTLFDGENVYSQNINHTIKTKSGGFMGGPSLACIEDIKAILSAAQTELKRKNEKSVNTKSIPGNNDSREGFFIDGQYYEAQVFIRELFKKSKKTIKIIDNYIDETVIDLLSIKSSKVRVEILTKKIKRHLKPIGKTFNKQYRYLNLRCSKAFHDRFIIIDDKEYYHLGASIKDLGNTTFMFSLLEEKEMITSLKDKWKVEWDKGEVVI